MRLVECDRDAAGGLDKLAAVLRAETFDALVDFSATEPAWVTELLPLVKGRVGLYVYISTDSVYEVCAPPAHDGLTVEEDAIRPADPALRAEKAELDEYGHEKLQCEEALSESGMPAVFLRLPDVIGPRDNTQRWLRYQLQLLTYPALGKRVRLPEELEQRQLSFVYAPDVAKAVEAVMTQGAAVAGRAFNLAFDETLTLRQLLTEMCSALGTKPDFKAGDGALFPSVDGRPISAEAARRTLGWRPTPWRAAVEDTCHWYMGQLEQATPTAAAEMEDFLVERVKEPMRARFLVALREALTGWRKRTRKASEGVE